MKTITKLLSIRYLIGSTYEKNISTMTIICLMSIMVGTFSLALVTAVMNGFEIATHEKMQNIHAPITIQAGGTPLDDEAIRTVIIKEFPEVKAVSSHSVAHVIIQPPNKEQSPIVVILKSIRPEDEILVTSLESKLYHTSCVQDALKNDQILIGKSLADNLSLTKGESFSLLYLDPNTHKRKATIYDQKAIMGGMFDTGIDEYDSSLILCTPAFIQKLFPDSGTTDIGISLHPNTNETEVLSRLQNRLGVDVYSWKDAYPALVSALKLEKYAMFFILVLITLVASMNIISLLFMLITNKRADIAILRALGTSSQTIITIFMRIGLLIAMIASIIGLSFAWIASWLLEQYPFIKLPDAYYVSHLPVKMEWSILLTVWATVMIISIIATCISTRQIRSIAIAEILRFEG